MDEQIKRYYKNLSSFGVNSGDENPLEGFVGNGSFIRGSFKFNTKWEVDLWGKIKDSKKASFYTMRSNHYNVMYAKSSLRGQFI